VTTTLSALLRRGGTIHLMGIGGAGMAGLALLLEARGARVSGCDHAESDATRELSERGIEVRRGHDPAHVEGAEAVIHTVAVPAEHAELKAARARGLPVLKRSEALAELVNSGKLVAVSGTHGKTTTTALTALALQAAGFDPTALVGGRVSGWSGNALISGSDIFVVEADEYDRSFLTLWPTVAVVTSVEAEHLDTYESAERMEDAFDEFVNRVPERGRVVACVDDPGARARLRVAGERGLAYGLGTEAELRAERVAYDPEVTRFSVEWRRESLGEFRLALRGRHNVRNALAALGVLIALEADPRAASSAWAGFAGVDRRFQRLGEAAGIAVVDDYAHHPTEVLATLEAARQVFPDRRIVAAFQPHLFSRTRAFADDFGRALVAADLVLITGIYPAREKPIPGVTGELVADAARREVGGQRVRYAEGLDELWSVARRELRAGDVFLTMGAGNIGEVAHRLFDELRRLHVGA
jgi:UDP-N-acetylmuramate--alanine ligase